MSAVSESDGSVKKKPSNRVLYKRPLSASPLRPVSADAVKKGNRRCGSLTRPGFTKRGVGAGAATSPSSVDITSLPESVVGRDRSPKNVSAKSEKNSARIKMQRLLSTKKREYQKLQKNLIEQQKTITELYANIRELETRLGCKAENFEDLQVISVASWPAHDLLMLVRDGLQFPIDMEVSGVVGPQVLQQLFAELNPVPEEVTKMGAELMARREDLLYLLRTRPSSGVKNPESKVKNNYTELDQDTVRLERLVAGTTENIKAKINYSLELAKIPWLDRENYVKKIQLLEKDNLALLIRMEEFERRRDQEKPPQLAEGAHPDLQAVQQELARERSARESLKEVVGAAESMLRVARGRIATLERQLKDNKAELHAAHRKHKELELLHRHRESTYDVRSKKLLEVSKTGEITIESLSKQRDALEIRVKELREQTELAERLADSRQKEMDIKERALQAEIAELEVRNQKAEDHSVELDIKVKELKETIHALREKSIALVNLERKRCIDYLPQKEGEPSDNETVLWKELQTVRGQLLRAEEQLRQCRADKENFLMSLSKMVQDGAENLQDKLAAELLEREKTIAKLQKIVEEQRENEKQMEQSMTQYEDQLANLRLQVKRLQNYDCYVKDDPTFQDLQTELLDMNQRVEALTRERAALASSAASRALLLERHERAAYLLDMNQRVEALTRERAALASAAASRALLLERHERAADLFARVTRARRGLEALLDGNGEPPSVEEFPFAEVSRSLSSVCDSAMETWSALRAERTRVLRLESAVVAQSLQLEREGRVRTQLECRRALLERELLRAQSSKSYETRRF